MAEDAPVTRLKRGWKEEIYGYGERDDGGHQRQCDAYR